jgi:hypothetical protein
MTVSLHHRSSEKFIFPTGPCLGDADPIAHFSVFIRGKAWF